MRTRLRTTTVALAGVLTLTGVAACSEEGADDTDRVELEEGEQDDEEDGGDRY